MENTESCATENTEDSKTTENNKKRRAVLSVQERLYICERLNMGENPAEVAAQFGVHLHSLSRIKRSWSYLADFSDTGNLSHKKMRCADNEHLEKELYKWYKTQVKLGNHISRPALRDKALEINKNIGGPSKFVASEGWLRNFKKRHGVNLLHFQYEKNEDDTSTDSFRQFLQEENINEENVYSMVEIGLLWKNLPGEETCHVMDRISLGLCANATGSHKLPLLFVHKYEKPRAFRHVTDKLPVVYLSQKEARVNVDIFSRWYTESFIPSIKQRHGEAEASGKVVLFAHRCPGQNLDQIPQEEGFEVMFSTTSTTQPADQSVAGRFKMRYRKRLLQHVINYPLGAKQFLVETDIKDCIDMAHAAWQEISRSYIRNSWDRMLETASDSDVPKRRCDYEDQKSLLEVAQMLSGTMTHHELEDWLQTCEASELHECCELDAGDDDSRGSDDETPLETTILGAERMEEMRNNLRFWSEGQYEKVRRKVQRLLEYLSR